MNATFNPLSEFSLFLTSQIKIHIKIVVIITTAKIPPNEYASPKKVLPNPTPSLNLSLKRKFNSVSNEVYPNTSPNVPPIPGIRSISPNKY